MLSLIGPTAHELVAEWGGSALVELPENAHATLDFGGAPVVVYKSSGLGSSVLGWTFILLEASAAEFWRRAALKVQHASSHLVELSCMHVQTSSP